MPGSGTFISAAAAAIALVALAHAAPPGLLPPDREIALAESAGPPAIAKAASIYLLERGGFKLAREGTNGFACLVTREDEGSQEPQCFDPEGVATLLPVALERATLIEQGLDRAAIEAKIGEGYASGKFRAPRRGGVTYMLSRENRVFNGEKIVNYSPHVMIMAPYVTNKDIGADYSDPAMPWVLGEGKPGAYVIVPVRDSAKKHEHKN